MNIKELNSKLNMDISTITSMLIPTAVQKGRYKVAGDISGSEGESLKITMSGSGTGLWKDYADGEKGGDLIELWGQVRCLDLSETLKQIHEYYGIEQDSFEKKYDKNIEAIQKPQCKMIIEGDPLHTWFNNRGISLKTILAYKVGATMKDELIFPYLWEDKLIMWKVRQVLNQENNKNQFSNKDATDCLFGWQVVGNNARTILITEGELDAMAFYEQGMPAVSVPRGGGGGAKQKWVENEYKRLERFDKIYLSLDMDEQGREGTKELITRLGQWRCHVVDLPKKDANDCLKEGINLQDYLNNAKPQDPVELKNMKEYQESVKMLFHQEEAKGGYGMKLPWRKTFDKIRIRPGEVSLWTGINGHGKTMVLNQIAVDGIANGEKFCIASMEMKGDRLFSRFVRQASGLSRPSDIYIDAIFEWGNGKVFEYSPKGQVKHKNIISVFKYARQRYGVTQFIIDSITKTEIKGDDFDGQKDFVNELTDLVRNLNCHIHLVAHSRKLQNEERIPGKMDVKGSGSLTDIVDNSFSVWRNKAKENNEGSKVQADAIIRCDKQRNGDWEGAISLFYDIASYQYREFENEKAKRYVNFTTQEEI